MSGRGLRAVFDAADRRQLAAASQRMVERTLVAGHGAHAGVVPLDDRVKQVHRALVRQIREEPRTIERGGDHEQRTVSGRPSR